MFKKLLVVLLVLVVVGLATIPLWSTKLADNAFEKPLDPKSPERVKDALLVKIRLQRYKQARQLAEKAVIIFPEAPQMPYFLYNAAKCAEQEGEHRVAIYWYARFIKKYPDHTWTTQAKNTLNKLKGMYETPAR